MFLGEVAGKRVVVQGVWGGGGCGGEDMPRERGGEEDGEMPREMRMGEGTTAPWARDGRREILERTKGGWAGVVPERR